MSLWCVYFVGYGSKTKYKSSPNPNHVRGETRNWDWGIRGSRHGDHLPFGKLALQSRRSSAKLHCTKASLHFLAISHNRIAKRQQKQKDELPSFGTATGTAVRRQESPLCLEKRAFITWPRNSVWPIRSAGAMCYGSTDTGGGTTLPVAQKEDRARDFNRLLCLSPRCTELGKQSIGYEVHSGCRFLKRV